MSFREAVRNRLQSLEQAHLLRAPKTLTGPQQPVVVINGRQVLCLCSNNYLGLANHPDLTEALELASRQVGVGSGASRHVSGTEHFHILAQQRLADMVARPAALLFSTGYAANVGTIQALAGKGDVIFSDALNHASLIDGMRLSRARTVVYPHRDMAALEKLLLEHRTSGQTALVVTDAIFSMDGDKADLRSLAELCQRHDAALMVDEAHALGVYGTAGAGLCAELGVIPDILIGTLGKAFGLSGAFVAAEADVVRLVENQARSYVFSTAAPAALAAATLTACDLVQAADDRRRALSERAQQLRAGLHELGYRTLPTETAVIPVMVGEPERVMAISAALLELGVFVHGIRPPTVPEGTSRLRVTAMATHSEAQIAQALTAFAQVRSMLQ